MLHVAAVSVVMADMGCADGEDNIEGAADKEVVADIAVRVRLVDCKVIAVVVGDMHAGVQQVMVDGEDPRMADIVLAAGKN